MTPDDIKKMEAFQDFSTKALIRSGCSFVLDKFAFAENNITAKGKVFVKTSSENGTLPIEIEWDLNGKSLSIGQQFDLIQEEPFDGWE